MPNPRMTSSKKFGKSRSFSLTLGELGFGKRKERFRLPFRESRLSRRRLSRWFRWSPMGLMRKPLWLCRRRTSAPLCSVKLLPLWLRLRTMLAALSLVTWRWDSFNFCLFARYAMLVSMFVCFFFYFFSLVVLWFVCGWTFCSISCGICRISSFV